MPADRLYLGSQQSEPTVTTADRELSISHRNLLSERAMSSKLSFSSLALLENTHSNLCDLLKRHDLSQISRVYAEHLKLLLAYEIAAVKTLNRKAAGTCE
jgi:hypothetical protein